MLSKTKGLNTTYHTNIISVTFVAEYGGKTMDNGNEFSNMYNKDEFNNDTPDISNEQPEKQESNIVGGNQRGTLYDFTKASKNT